MYIAAITGGVPRENISSKGTMKRKIFEMKFFYRKVAITSGKIRDRPMLGFCNSEKVGGIPNENFPLVITATVEKFYVSWILIEGGSFFYIIYSKLFEKIGLDRGSLWLYKGSDL